MSKIRKLLGALSDIFTVKKCVACRELLPYDSKDKLCEKCRCDWELEKRKICTVCFEAQVDCRCGFGKKSVDSVRHIALYSNEEKDCVVNKIIYALKKSNNSDVFEFVAQEMADELLQKKYMKNAVIAGIPRNPVAIRKYGYDHAKKLALCLSKLTGVKYIDAFGHIGGKTEQKKLNKYQREYNAKKNCYIKENCIEDIKGKNVWLVDDIGTTGAMMSACAELLKKNGAMKVNCIIAARNEKK